jgi:hypothetical protein
MDGLPQGVTNPPKPIVTTEGEPEHKTPGTMILVFVFLAAFVTYYFVNWKLLSFLWQIG